ncbi:MAG: riboflavin synthase [Clostridium sp.]|nr:riboflavin synthase [Clostridium sp.]
MFTGIIEEIGTLKAIVNTRTSARLLIQADYILSDIAIGDSIAVNGVCLTVCNYTKNSFEADVMHETLNRTAFSSLQNGSRVNLERAMPANGRFGGHIVSGHIDGTGEILGFRNDGIATVVTITTSPSIVHYIIEKGSIAIDGTSLTVTSVSEAENTFEVSLIPHTKDNTILLTKKKGELVNLENDVIGKYIERFLKPAPKEESKSSRITEEFLTKYGY